MPPIGRIVYLLKGSGRLARVTEVCVRFLPHSYLAKKVGSMLKQIILILRLKCSPTQRHSRFGHKKHNKTNNNKKCRK